MKSNSQLNTVLLGCILAIASWQLYTVQELAKKSEIALLRLAQHDFELVDARQRLATTEMDVTRLRIQLAAMTRQAQGVP